MSTITNFPPLPSAINVPMHAQRYQEAQNHEATGSLYEAFKLYEELAKTGYAPALVDTARCLWYGRGTLINYSHSAHLAKESLTKELSSNIKRVASRIMGLAYENGFF